MATYLFAWNPALWNWPEMAADIRQLSRRGHFDTEWNSGRVRNIEIGSRAFLIRVGQPPKGIFGAGHTLTDPVPTPHWRPERASAGAIQQRLTLRLEALHPLPLVTYDDLGVPPFARFRWGVRSSGVRIPSTLADLLENLWEARTAGAAKAGPKDSPHRGRRG
jgi:5-methylcytosine-specific restriction protein A